MKKGNARQGHKEAVAKKQNGWPLEREESIHSSSFQMTLLITTETEFTKRNYACLDLLLLVPCIPFKNFPRNWFALCFDVMPRCINEHKRNKRKYQDATNVALKC